jgi:hypothetical protein
MQKTILFRMTKEVELTFDVWYEHKKYKFNSKDLALKQWTAMCKGADEEIWEESELTWNEIKDRCDAIQKDNDTSEVEGRMRWCLDEAVELFEDLDITFHEDWSCCNNCGHHEATEANYVFYHSQDTDRLRKGSNEVHLAFQFEDDKKAEVIEMISHNSHILYWSGDDETKIYLTCDKKLMEKHTMEDAKHQAHMSKM